MQSLLVMNSAGAVVVEKHWRAVVNRSSISDYFWEERRKYRSPEDVPPVIVTPKCYLVNIRVELLWFVMTLQQEFPPLLVIEFLHRVAEVFKDYFQELSEEAIKENFLTAFELMDELMDNGFPLTTEPNVLQEMIKPHTAMRKATAIMAGASPSPSSSVGRKLPQGSQSNIRWRKSTVKHSTNEIYVDITEEVEATFSRGGLVTPARVQGDVQVNCRLSGLPDLTLVFANPTLLDDVSFHPCVRYSRYEKERVISFIPPDGEFRLMTYRVPTVPDFSLPVSIKPDFSWTEHGGKFEIAVAARPPAGKNLEKVVLTVEFPRSAAAVNLNCQVGSIKYDEVTKTCRWSLGKLPKPPATGKLTGTISLASGEGTPQQNPTVLVNFRIPTFGVSKLKVSHLHVANARYKLFKGVRTVTVGGRNLQFRC